MKLNQTIKRVICLCLSVLLVAGTVTPVFAATNNTDDKNKILAEIVASIDTNYANAEEAVKIHLAQSESLAVISSDEFLKASNDGVDATLAAIDTVVADATARLQNGCANSNEALTVLTNIAMSQAAAQQVNETAKADLETAKANLAAAQVAYDEATAIAAEGKVEIEKQLEVAKAAVGEAEAVLEKTTNKLIALESLLAEAAADVNAWKAEAKNALAVAGTHLEESNAQLDATLKALEIENAEFVASVEAFQAQSEVFVESVKVLAEKVEVAQEKEAYLESLYAEYEAVLATYEAALNAFETVVGEECSSYADAEAIMHTLTQNVTDAKEAIADAEQAEIDANAAIEEANKNIIETTEKRDAAQESFDATNELISAALTGSEDKVKELAYLVIKEYLAGNCEVVWNDKTTNEEYGKSENGFFVVLKEDGSVAERYGYLLEGDVVNIYKMKAEKVTNYVEYDGKEYALNKKDEKFYITVNGKDLEVREERKEQNERSNNVVYKVVELYDKPVFTEYDAREVELEEETPDKLAFVFKILGEEITIDFGTLKEDENGTYSVIKDFTILGQRINQKWVASKSVDENNEVVWSIEKYNASYEGCKLEHTKTESYISGYEKKYSSWGIPYYDAIWSTRTVSATHEETNYKDCETTSYNPTGEFVDTKYIEVVYKKGYELSEKLDPEDTTVDETSRKWYSLEKDDKDSNYITVNEKKVDITVKDELIVGDILEGEVEYKTTYKHHYTVKAENLVEAEYIPGGDKNTFFVLGDKVEENSLTLYNARLKALNDYIEDLKGFEEDLKKANADLTTAQSDLVAATNALAAAEAEYANAVDAFHALAAEYAKFEEKDLGVLASLPKNIEEFGNSSTIDSLEDIKALVEAINVINNDRAGIEEKINAYKALASYVPMLELLVPDFENMSGWEKLEFMWNFGSTELGKILDGDSFQHKYFVAWLDALVAKIEVIQAGIVVVDEANKTITSGLELIYAGAELSDASIQTMIEKIKNDVLSGTVAALTIAVDVVEVSDEMINAIYEQVAVLRGKVSVAEAELETAVARLEELEIQNPGQNELNAAKEKLAAATNNYNTLVEKLASVEAYLVEAENCRVTAQAQYEALLEAEKPAEPGEGPVELPTPGVDYDEDQEPAQPGEGPVELPTPGVDYDEDQEPAQPGEGPVELPTPGVDYDEDQEPASPEEGPVELPTPGVDYDEDQEPAQPGEGPVELPTPGVDYDEDQEPAQPGEGPVELPTPSVDYDEDQEPASPEEGPVELPTPEVEYTQEETIVIYGPVESEVEEETAEDEVEEDAVVTDDEITIDGGIVDIVDGETPLSDGTTDIADVEVPLASNKEEDEEALAPVVTAVAGAATVAVAGTTGFIFFRKRKFF